MARFACVLARVQQKNGNTALVRGTLTGQASPFEPAKNTNPGRQHTNAQQHGVPSRHATQNSILTKGIKKAAIIPCKETRPLANAWARLVKASALNYPTQSQGDETPCQCLGALGEGICLKLPDAKPRRRDPLPMLGRAW